MCVCVCVCVCMRVRVCTHIYKISENLPPCTTSTLVPITCAKGNLKKIEKNDM